MKLRGIIIVILSTLAILSLYVDNVSAQWLNGWAYRRPIAISNNCQEQMEKYQVGIQIGNPFDFSKALSDGRDIRFTLSDGITPIQFWMDGWDPDLGAALCWVNLPSIPLGDSTIYIYYGNPAAAESPSDGISTFDIFDGFEDYGIGTAPSAIGNPGEWTRYEGNPILTPGPTGAWDDHGATFATVIWDEAVGEFRMYYHGFSGSVHQIGLATSSDGIHWTKYAGNPIVTPGPDDWDNQSVRVPMVWKEGANDYRMIYTGRGTGGMQLGYAISTDGIHWTKNPSNPVFNDPTWAHGETENWGVMKVGDEYLVWYSDFGMRQAGIAVSTDLINWTPYQSDPIFSSSGDPSDDRYSQFCPYSFKYNGYYYVLVPSYDSGSNYSKNYLYRSSSPYFPESDRHLVRVTRTVGAEGEWDDHDGDTPYVLTLDIERTVFYNNELWCYYSSEGGSDMWKEGLMIETNIDSALADAPLPAEEEFTWKTDGDVKVVDTPVRSGVRSICQTDTSATYATKLTGSFRGMEMGRVSAWMHRESTSDGDYDMYLYGGSNLACVAGLGRDGDFHYWDGEFKPTGVNWDVDTWYLVTIMFDATTDQYDFVVFDQNMSEIVRVDSIAFGNSSSYIDKAMLYTSMAYVGRAYADDFRVSKWCGTDLFVEVGNEETSTTDVPQSQMIPKIYILNQNYPNPFNPYTTIKFYLPYRSHVTLDIFDVEGSLVARLIDGERSAGNCSVHWNGIDSRGHKVSSGIYFYRLKSGKESITRKMILIR